MASAILRVTSGGFSSLTRLPQNLGAHCGRYEESEIMLKLVHERRDAIDQTTLLCATQNSKNTHGDQAMVAGDVSLTTTAKHYVPRRSKATRYCYTSPAVGR